LMAPICQFMMMSSLNCDWNAVKCACGYHLCVIIGSLSERFVLEAVTVFYPSDQCGDSAMAHTSHVNLSRAGIDCATADDLYSGHPGNVRQRASCASTFSNRSLPTGCAPSQVTLMYTNFPANTVPGLLPGPYHRTRLPPTTCRAMRSRKRSMRMAFNFGACAPRREDS
jgi:hypothetical protein